MSATDVRSEEWEDCVIGGPHGYHLTWTYIGEGLDGDYDASDPDDRPILRADLHVPDNADGLSYATLATTSVPEERLREISRDLFDALPADPRAGGIRSVMERWTWRTSDTPKESPDV